MKVNSLAKFHSILIFFLSQMLWVGILCRDHITGKLE